MEIEFNIRSEEFIGNIQQRINKIPGDNKDAMDSATDWWLKESQRTIPVVSGKARGRLRKRVSRPGMDVSGGVILDVYYSEYLLYGNKYMLDGQVSAWRMGDPILKSPSGYLPAVRPHAKKAQQKFMDYRRRTLT